MLTIKEKLKQRAFIELARRDFFYFCNLKSPDFYKKDRIFLKKFCNDLQDFYFSDDDILIVNLPPRHGKSRTACNFVEWILGINPSEKVMTGSYNETLSTTFSKNIRNSINEVKADENKVVYNDVFPNTKIKQGDGAMNMWSIENGYNSYLATSPTGTATGFGCSLMIIDDLIKSSYEAHNINILNNHWSWFTDTMLSRLEEKAKIIIVMTRWHSKDLAGRCLDYYKEIGANIKHISYSAINENGKMLCDEILSFKTYQNKIRAMGEDIASANYLQKTIDLKGKLYTKFKIYENIEDLYTKFEKIKLYCDTADTGEDYLCNIIYGVYENEAYILDVYYTKEPMEITEVQVAKRIKEFNVNVADIESNNGGRGFARAIERNLKILDFNKCVINTFHQSQNKKARILSNSSWVMEHIYYPYNFKNKFREFYTAIYEYQKEGKNEHDDAPDALTGICEKINSNKLKSINKKLFF